MAYATDSADLPIVVFNWNFVQKTEENDSTHNGKERLRIVLVVFLESFFDPLESEVSRHNLT